MLKNILTEKLTIQSFLALLLVSSSVFADDSQDYTPKGTLVGEARMSYLFWDIYDVKLYTNTGKWPNKDTFELELTYLRALDGKAIAERSIDEMAALGLDDENLKQQWLQQMRSIFPDVEDGTVLVGVVDNLGITTFYRDGHIAGVIENPEFSKWFFNIWLGENTSEPKIRKKLIGA